MLRFHMDSSVSSIGAADEMPALETRMSTPPYSTAVPAKAAATPGSSVTSRRTVRTASLENAAPSSSRVFSSAGSSMSASMTQAPSRSSRAAIALPMPPAPPVMKATRPASDFGFGMR